MTIKSEDPRTSNDPAEPKVDYWVIKVDSLGEKIWDRTYGGAFDAGDEYPLSVLSGEDKLVSIVASEEGGYLLAGISNSGQGFEKSESSTNHDYWLIKINESGEVEWDKTLISNTPTNLYSVIRTDGGYILGGVQEEGNKRNDEYNDYIDLIKIDYAGNVLWNTTSKYGSRYDKSREIISLAGNSTGFYVLSQFGFPENPTSPFISRYNHSGQALYHREVFYYAPQVLNIYSDNLLLGYWIREKTDDINSNIKYGIALLSDDQGDRAPGLEIEFTNEFQRSIDIHASPFFITDVIAKVEFYGNGEKLGEVNGQKYYYTWEKVPFKNNKVFAKAILSSGAEIYSDTVDYKELGIYGSQAESAGDVLEDLGNNDVLKEKYSSLNAGSSIRLWDIGDRYRFFVGVSTSGIYKIKVHLRSGGYGTNYDNPTSFWPDGYSLWYNGKPINLTGDVNSVSAKNPAYGGSYWGTMVSDLIYLEAGIGPLEIIANKKWAGIDYIEFVPFNKIEAEYIYSTLLDPGAHPTGEEVDNSLSGRSSAKLWDIGDKIRLTFSATA